MKYTHYRILLFAFALGLTSVISPAIAQTAAEKQRGVCFVAGRSVSEADFVALKNSNVNWISQTPFGWQSAHDSPEIRLARSGRVLWGERDEGIRKTTLLARKHGIKTLLKPHIWLRARNTDKWRSDIAMRSEADWQKWFGDYRTFIVHYAKLAQELNIEALSIGTELHATIKQRPQDWLEIILAVRKVYDGELTYSANWYKEFEDVTFWQELDFIGIQGYFPLAKQHNPDLASLKAGWQSHIPAIAAVQKRVNKPVVFTEIGYKSTEDTAIEPWTWHRRGNAANSEAALKTQALCYEAFFQTFWQQDWFAGTYIWKWFPGNRLTSGRRIDPFSPQNKPAQKVMETWFGM